MDLCSSFTLVCREWFVYINGHYICYHYLCLFYICMYLFFDWFLFLVLQLWLIWSCGNWTLLILLHQTPVLPPLFPYHCGACYKLLCIFDFFWHLLCSGFCIPTSSDSLSFKSSYHRLDSFLALVCSHRICNCYMSLLCLCHCSFAHAFYVIKFFIFFYCLYLCFLCSLPLDPSGLG